MSILSSNNVGLQKFFNDWLKEYGYSSGVEIKFENKKIQIIGENSSYIVITKLPENLSIEYVRNTKICFMNIKTDSESGLPKLYLNSRVSFEYCKIPKSYVDKIVNEHWIWKTIHNNKCEFNNCVFLE